MHIRQWACCDEHDDAELDQASRGGAGIANQMALEAELLLTVEACQDMETRAAKEWGGLGGNTSE
ncbi:hypothetical protein N4G70_32090 [Streptomyces sp. ASQP_92]|uniref:hypothetical protein n=1 Tax=Streptomyces sp. ASQP_92 TaxID=2979116 RepID=UPI0021BFDD9F|nr:hypothetical protein [Streptomyces sp. ASQP_92]MCT9093475.1 hypothetical protein [Streptomyces sp. ASQP_92]